MQKLVSTRRVVAVTTSGWVAFGLLHGGLRALVMPAIPGGTWRTVLMATAIDVYWVPVSLAVLGMTWSDKLARRSKVVRALRHAAFALASTAVWPLWAMAVLFAVRHQQISYAQQVQATAGTALLTYIAILAVAVAASALEHYAERHRRFVDLQESVIKARLSALTLQLQPHFLFNTLHLASELVHDDRPGALHVLRRLREMLADTFAERGGHEGALAQEVAVVQRYLDIQMRRFGTRLRVEVDIDSAAMKARVPLMLLQPLAENAIRHTVGRRPGAGVIGLYARVEGDRLRMVVWDTGEGPEATQARTGVSGLGIANTCERLAAAYGADHAFELRARAGGGAEAVIACPFREFSPPQSPVDAPLAEDAEPDIPIEERGPSPWLLALAPVALLTVMEEQLFTVWWSEAHIHLASPIHLSAIAVNGLSWLVLVPGLAWLHRRAMRLDWPMSRVLMAGVAIAAAAAAVHLGLLSMLLPAIGIDHISPVNTPIVGIGLLDFLAAMSIVAMYGAVAYANASRLESVRLVEARGEYARVELETLTRQAHPQLLLALLERVSQVAESDAMAADDAIGRLGDLLRMLLARRPDSVVCVEEELSLVRAYMDVLRGTGLPVLLQVDIAHDARGGELPSFTLLSALLATTGLPPIGARSGWNLTITVMSDGVMLYIAVHAHGLTPGTVANPDALREGDSLMKRLHALFGGEAHCEFTRAGASARAVIRLPVISAGWRGKTYETTDLKGERR